MNASSRPTPSWRQVAERALKALADLSFECDGVVSTSAPTRETYNRTFHELRELQEISCVPSESTRIAPPTKDEISAYRDLFRAELGKRMDTSHPSASPSTESHEIALRAFVESRNRSTPSAELPLKHLQDAPLTLRNTFQVQDPNDPKKTVAVVYASFAVCLERKANQRTPSSSRTATSDPTPKMIEAGELARQHWDEKRNSVPLSLFIYRAMMTVASHG